MNRWLDDWDKFPDLYKKKHLVHKTRYKQGKLSLQLQLKIVSEKYHNYTINNHQELIEKCSLLVMCWDDVDTVLQLKYKKYIDLFLKNIQYATAYEVSFFIDFVKEYPKLDLLIEDKKCILLTINECYRYIQDNLYSMPEQYLEQNSKFIRKLGNKTLSQSLVSSFISDFGFTEVIKNSNVYGKYL